jgi:hypothetical protein
MFTDKELQQLVNAAGGKSPGVFARSIGLRYLARRR